MYALLVVRLVHQVLGGMSAALATRTLAQRPFVVLRAYLRERGLLRDGDAFASERLEAVRWLRHGREATVRACLDAVDSNTAKAAVFAVALGKLRVTPKQTRWAARLFAWAEAKRKGERAKRAKRQCTQDGWIKAQQRKFDALAEEQRVVLAVLGREWAL